MPVLTRCLTCARMHAAAEAAKGLTEMQLAQAQKLVTSGGSALAQCKAELLQVESAVTATMAQGAVTGAAAKAIESALQTELQAAQALCEERAAKLEGLAASESALTAEVEKRRGDECAFSLLNDLNTRYTVQCSTRACRVMPWSCGAQEACVMQCMTAWRRACRKALQEQLAALSKQAQDAKAAHEGALLEQRKAFDKELKVGMRQVEEQAAAHLASIRTDADGAAATATELAQKNTQLECKCDLMPLQLCSC